MLRPRVEFLYLVEDQEGIVTWAQAICHGVSAAEIRTELRAGRWTRLHHGVYATFTGGLTFTQRVWAAVLSAGEGAVVSHETAAYLQGILSKEPEVVRLTVPTGRHIDPVPGVKILRSVRVEEARHWRKFLPQTTVEDTVLDLVDEQRRPEAVIGLITTACQKRLTSPIRLTQAVAKRKRLRWRKLVVELLTAVEEGVESPLEWRYARDVERAHGLPRGKRQARANHKGRIYLRDVFYEEYQTVVELDGRAAHPDDEAHRDMRRDNAAAERAEVTLRYGWPDVAGRPCQVAVQVAGFLTARGWGDSPTRCGPQCLIPSRRS